MATAPDTDFAPTSHKGLTYPFGGAEPEVGGTMQVAPGIDWVRLHIPGPLRHVNCWLLADTDGEALVDTGMNTAAARDAWKAIFKGPKADVRITRMIGTHFHPDHIGLAGWMCDHHAAPLIMTRAEWLTARMLAADARDSVPHEMLTFWRGAGWAAEQIDHATAKGWAGFRKIITPLPLSYTRIEDGDTLTIGTRDWRVVTGSGHSPEHACLYDEAGGIVIAGDQVLPRISPNVSLGVTEPNADPLGEWFASIAKLKTLPADLLVLPGHGDPFTGLHTRLDAMDREHRERLDELAVFLAEPRRAVDCFGRLFRRAIGQDVLGMATGEALAHLRRLEVEGRATRDIQDGVWWWRAA
ncbi:glyoxylase-like metal-dependent hydrolase (beta-lactamase superfamily II) [Sphingomonas faeni]|uniref:Glyoxylase-like metal-dependent hydrolase (Beta-lactamase superfamily II) n=1 Tax=Sphingomonas faeni TaxID=185950 RepID=A0A2T5UBV4_9SPHN|nr:MBL fold metallo-hydrolase [Sphingomonas faeni]PTW48973.1 glyoxylase-like metal-dependent hydrolase (beta-lactamase superfamily II) [Sphingomonas faeni]